MSEHPFQKFIDLIQFDRETQVLHQNNEKLQKEIANLELTKNKLLHSLEEGKKNVLSLKKKVDELELSMKELDSMESEKKKRLEEVSGPREYKSIQSELAAVNKKQHDLEQELVDLWNKYESAQKQSETLQTESVQKLQEEDTAIEQMDNELSQINQKIEGREQEREVLKKGIPEEWLDSYATMRRQVTNPVVPVVGDSCSACFYPVTAQVIQELKAHKLVPCRSCYRLLYIKELQEKLAEEPSQKE